MRSCLIAIILLLCSSLSAMGDDGYFGGQGETVWPLNNEQIEMVEEEVKLSVEPHPQAEHSYFADCTFVFRNTGNAANVQMGFPDYPSRDVEQSPTIEDFTCLVDSEPVKVEARKGLPHPLDPELLFEKVYVWNVPFKKGETKIIKNTYRFRGYGIATGERTVPYVLRTGALWKGPIGKAKISVHGLDTRFVESIEPQGYTFDSNSIQWNLTNIKPEIDIAVRYNELGMGFAALCDAFYASDKHTEKETVAFVKELDFFVERLYWPMDERVRAVSREYARKIAYTVPHSCFGASQLGMLLEFIGESNEEAAPADGNNVQPDIRKDGNVVPVRDVRAQNASMLSQLLPRKWFAWEYIGIIFVILLFAILVRNTIRNYKRQR